MKEGLSVPLIFQRSLPHGSKKRSGLQLKLLALNCVFHFVFLCQTYLEMNKEK